MNHRGGAAVISLQDTNEPERILARAEKAASSPPTTLAAVVVHVRLMDELFGHDDGDGALLPQMIRSLLVGVQQITIVGLGSSFFDLIHTGAPFRFF